LTVWGTGQMFSFIYPSNFQQSAKAIIDFLCKGCIVNK